MIISLDYDDTYTRDPEFWDDFVKKVQDRGHIVYVVTLRFPNQVTGYLQHLNNITSGVFYTSWNAKRSFMYEKGINIDIWIDDMPEYIVNNLE